MDDRALYVYGVVPSTASAELFADVAGVDPAERVVLVPGGGETSAIASAVRLDEFGEEAIDQNLHDPRWLAEKARAHDEVLAAAVGRTTVLPFRFGAIYRSEEQLLDMLRDRSDFPATLRRLEGTLEVGVKASVDVAALRERLAAAHPVEEGVPAGRAYMQRKQRARELDEAVERFGSECAREAHDRLSSVARDARMNTVQHREEPRSPHRMILNGAYLVGEADEPRFRRELEALQAAHSSEGVAYELTGPWPPYNFTEEEEDGA